MGRAEPGCFMPAQTPPWLNPAPLIALRVSGARHCGPRRWLREVSRRSASRRARRDTVPVHVGPKIRTDTCEDQAHPLLRQIIEQIANGPRREVVHICCCARIDDEPADQRRRALHECAHFVGEAIIVRVKQIGTEAIDHEPWFSLLARRRGHRCPPAGTRPARNIIVCGRGARA